MHRGILMACLLLGVAISTPVGAGDPIKIENIGPVFGGANVMANTSAESTLELDNLPCIVEDYTATWCSNCVDVEHALADIKNDTGLQLYMMHRYFGEQQDPFGTELSGLRWQDRYESRLPNSNLSLIPYFISTAVLTTLLVTKFEPRRGDS